MRIAYVLPLVAVAAASSVSVSASQGTAVANDSAASDAALASAASLYKLSHRAYQRVRGDYELDDGRVLRVSAAHGKVYAELDGALTEIVPTGPNQFASHDDALRVRFDDTAAVRKVEVSVPRGLATGAAPERPN